MAERKSSFIEYIRTFLVRHDRLLSIVGALIVFLTFVTRDELRDNWQAIANGLETAQYFYSLRVNTSEPATFEGTEARLGLSELGETPTPPTAKASGSEYDRLKAEVITYKKQNEALAVRIDNLRILADKLPASASFGPRLDALLSRSRALAATDSGTRPPADDLDPDLNRQILELDKSSRDGAFDTLRSLRNDVDALDLQIISSAKAEYETNKSRAHLADISSIMLYIFGWSLGVVGKAKSEES